VADNEYGIRLIDMTDLSRPLLTGGYPTSEEPKSIYISDRHLYMGAYDAGAYRVTLSKPGWIFTAAFRLFAGFDEDL
jgi:hypothetical protein